MKKAIVILSIILLIALVFITLAKKQSPVVIYKNNQVQKPVDFKVGHANCALCAMVIKDKNNSVEVSLKDGRTWFFDDPGCMVNWIKDKPFKDSAKIWVYTLDTHRWIDAREAFLGTNDKTAMHYGFGAREKKVDGTISFEQMVKRILKSGK